MVRIVILDYWLFCFKRLNYFYGIWFVNFIIVKVELGIYRILKYVVYFFGIFDVFR